MSVSVSVSVCVCVCVCVCVWCVCMCVHACMCECISVVRASECKSEDPGFDPLQGRVRGSFSVSPSQLWCRLVCA